MSDLELLRVELEQQRRSVAMLPPQAHIPRERALELVTRCQAAIEAARRIG